MKLKTNERQKCEQARKKTAVIAISSQHMQCFGQVPGKSENNTSHLIIRNRGRNAFYMSSCGSKAYCGSSCGNQYAPYHKDKG